MLSGFNVECNTECVVGTRQNSAHKKLWVFEVMHKLPPDSAAITYINNLDFYVGSDCCRFRHIVFSLMVVGEIEIFNSLFPTDGFMSSFEIHI